VQLVSANPLTALRTSAISASLTNKRIPRTNSIVDRERYCAMEATLTTRRTEELSSPCRSPGSLHLHCRCNPAPKRTLLFPGTSPNCHWGQPKIHSFRRPRPTPPTQISSSFGFVAGVRGRRGCGGDIDLVAGDMRPEHLRTRFSLCQPGQPWTQHAIHNEVDDVSS